MQTRRGLSGVCGGTSNIQHPTSNGNQRTFKARKATTLQKQKVEMLAKQPKATPGRR
jgi:hypothetical protein